MARGFRMADCLYRFLIHTICVIGICCLLGAGRCATTKGAGAERAETIAGKVETVKGIIRSSNLSDEQKRAAETVLDAIAIDSRALGRDVDHNKTIADDNAEAASNWRWLVGISIVAALAVGGFFIKRAVS